MDTIYALTTGYSVSAIAIIRISGDSALTILQRLSNKMHWEPRKVRYVQLKDEEGALLDDAVAVYFPHGQSYTGLAVVELFIHGGRAVINDMLDYLSKQPELRLAEAGEFTRQAVENGRMDLLEAEAVIDVIHAETKFQKKQALKQLGGSLSQLYEDWRERMIKALAWYEAHLDFSDEEIPGDLDQQVQEQITQLNADIQKHISDGAKGETLRNGVQLAIVGAPNAGKSSLLNYLVKEDAAIVSEIAGTTRDIVERHLDIGGFPVIIADTAGLRETDDVIEQEGIRRAKNRALSAQLLIALFDATKECDLQTLSLLHEFEGEVIILQTKKDLLIKNIDDTPKEIHSSLLLNLHDQEDLQKLDHILQQKLSSICATGENPLITRQRHRLCLQDVHMYLTEFDQGFDTVLKAESLRCALAALGRLTGRIDVDELLDTIFSDFCIGK